MCYRLSINLTAFFSCLIWQLCCYAHWSTVIYVNDWPVWLVFVCLTGWNSICANLHRQCIFWEYTTTHFAYKISLSPVRLKNIAANGTPCIRFHWRSRVWVFFSFFSLVFLSHSHSPPHFTRSVDSLKPIHISFILKATKELLS